MTALILTVLTLTSPSFSHNDSIPAHYTCDGKDISPALHWTGIPDGTKSLVLIVDDPDAPDPSAPKMTWVHTGYCITSLPAPPVWLKVFQKKIFRRALYKELMTGSAQATVVHARQ